MPPKKKGKGGKGAAGDANVLSEPSQPAPGAPYCLSLVLEVSLDAAEPPAAAEPNGADTQAPDVGGEDTQPVEQGPYLVEPAFRYTFVNGDKITTPPIGLAGSSWVRVDPTVKDAAPDSALSQQLETKTINDEQREVGPGPAKHAVWRYTRVHQLQGGSDDEVALTLDRNPIMQVILADKSLREATAQPPGPGEEGGISRGIEADAAERGNAGIPGRNFIESWPLDLSAFLSGETSIAVYAGRASQSRGHLSTRSRSSPDVLIGTANAGRCTNSAGAVLNDKVCDAPPSPRGIRSVRISVSLPGATVAEENATQMSEGVDDGKGSVAGGAVSCSGLLSAETVQRLNPLSIKFTSAVSLPGMRIEAESLQHHVKPTRFRLLESHCKPVYLVCRPFPDDPLNGSLHSRIVWTAGSAQQEMARFNHTSAFLLGPMDRYRLEEWVENFTLAVEVHDRDPRPTDEERKEKILRLERMLVGGYPDEDGTCDPSDGGSPSKPEDDEEIAAGGERTQPVRYGKPRDIYEVDELALREAIACAESSGKETAHGVASFQISGLLDQSRQLVSAYSNNKRKLAKDAAPEPVGPAEPTADVAPRLKIRSEICQRKRREIPKGGVEEWHLSDEQRLVRCPGAYLDAGSSLGLRLSLANPLRTLQEGSAERTGPATEEPRPFTRAVLVVEYEEGGPLIREITTVMDKINGRALKGAQGSLRSYRLTTEEKQAVHDGGLDVVCGFMVIDEDSRTIVLEGVAGPKGGLTNLLRRVGRAGPNGQAYRVLENPAVRFSRRLYTCFDADLKKVRLRDPLPVLCRNPEIYDRSKVSADCFDALHCLHMLRKVNRMREAAEQNLFPGAAQLIQVESKYGESISVKDITGRNPVKKQIGNVAGGGALGESSADERAAQLEPGGAGSRADNDGEREAETEKQAPARRKAPTDSKNEAFEEGLRCRRPRDFLAEQEETLAKIHQELLDSQRRRREEREAETVQADWCYGPQKLNYVELKKAEMRERLAKDTGATYTYSVDYVSQTVSLVDEFRLREDEEAKSRAAWKTKRGFVWPCPRTRQELITHPSKPSESRIDTLKEPWVENELSGGRLEETAEGSGGNKLPHYLAWRKKFDTVPSNGNTIFGGFQVPKYGRSLDTDMIGSRSRLPRGYQHLEKDPEFFRSVHLVGEGLAREKAEIKRKEEELWRNKVVVDDTDFRVGNFSVRDTPLQVDRAKDILHLPIKKTAFKMVRNARLPSGKHAPLRPPPVSAFSSEPFAEPEDFTVSIRGNHRERWTGTDPATGDKADFYLRLHGDRMKRRSHKVVARRKHPPLKPSEMRGPRWETGRTAGSGRRVVEAVQESGPEK